ncbi:hypothetical protein CBF23_005970 [Marinomonas agarivorans]|nr:hypothetical protein CBF23_005970 [Marinomonas agarivorans]
MLLKKIGIFSWLIQEGETSILINSQLGSFLQSDFDYNFLYEDLEFFPVLDGINNISLVQLSEQYQYYSPSSIKLLNPKKIISHHNCSLDRVSDENIIIRSYNEWHTEGKLQYLFIPAAYGDSFWDNVGASIYIRNMAGETVYIQGNNAIPDANLPNYPKAIKVSILSFNCYSTINKTSAYFNEYDDEEYFNTSDDLKLLMHLVDSIIPSEFIVLQGTDFKRSKCDEISRSNISEYTNLLSPYLLGTKIIDVKVGQKLSLDDYTISSLPRNEKYKKECRTNFKVTEHNDRNKLLENFLTELAKIVLLTGFGKNMFGCSSVNNITLSEFRFCFSIIENGGKLSNYAFNISKNAFEFIPQEIPRNKIRSIFPFGLEIEAGALIKVIKGEGIFWDLANSKKVSQWYLGHPKNSPVTLLFIYFQEVCNQAILKNYWSLREI